MRKPEASHRAEEPGLTAAASCPGMEGCCRCCMPCCSRLWNYIWPDFRYPNVPNNNNHVIANPAAHTAEIRTVSGDIRVPSPKKRQVQLYAALFDFEARSDDELTVKEGDKLSVIEKRGEYVLAKKLTGSLESGLIPANYVALLQDEFAKHKWYYGNINRGKAEKLLLASQNKDGSFLVRISESHSDEYTISARSEGKVYHFRIQRSTIGAYFVSDKVSFGTLGELISYYRRTLAASECRSRSRRELFDMEPWERPREEFRLHKKLGEGHFGEVWEALWTTENKKASQLLPKRGDSTAALLPNGKKRKTCGPVEKSSNKRSESQLEKVYYMMQKLWLVRPAQAQQREKAPKPSEEATLGGGGAGAFMVIYGLPCLETLWQRIFSDKKTPPGGGGDGGGGGGGGSSSMDGTGGSSPPSPAPQEKGSESGSMFWALWSFESRHPDELSFQEGDLFSVISRTGDWWTARRIDKNGRVLDTGVVPKNYLDRAESLQTQPWFFGTMNRIEAQSHLMGTGNDSGAFLIRHSEKDQVGYVLSVKASVRVKHFKVHTANETNFYIEHNLQVTSLIDLVEHYCANDLNNTGKLGNPCKRKKPPTTDLSHFTVDEWELPKDEFTLLEELGSGYFADVYRGRWKNHINVAIKILKSAFNNQEAYEQVSNGYRMPAPSNCPNLLYKIMLQCWSFEPDVRPDFKTGTTQVRRVVNVDINNTAVTTSEKCTELQGQRLHIRQAMTSVNSPACLLARNHFYRNSTPSPEQMKPEFSCQNDRQNQRQVTLWVSMPVSPVPIMGLAKK
ncbi:hypothetical protein F7725_001044 [Dissostichus mawsoni]|uniref:Tyrosine-protein kinase n=1 Tax=Dissostichus mawsoni TaxID=36200 RepID=A0A7J5ZIK1_DISMA|nr:hypothetical protein F7725_001044 [Dissostichus mawsoni]